MLTEEERQIIMAIRNSMNPSIAAGVIVEMLSDADNGMPTEEVKAKWITDENKRLFQRLPIN